MSKAINKYIESALHQKLTKEEIHANLILAGWPSSQIQKSLSKYYDTDQAGIIIPQYQLPIYGVIKDLFLYSLSFITLSLCIQAFLSLSFNIINYASHESLEDINIWAISRLIVSFPMYLMSLHWINLDIQQHQEKLYSLVRKLCIYMIYFILVISLLVEVIVTLHCLLTGDYSLAFGGKSFCVLLAVGVPCIFYYLEIEQSKPIHQS